MSELLKANRSSFITFVVVQEIPNSSDECRAQGFHVGRERLHLALRRRIADGEAEQLDAVAVAAGAGDGEADGGGGRGRREGIVGWNPAEAPQEKRAMTRRYIRQGGAPDSVEHGNYSEKKGRMT
jgi:hypothetical protein